MQNLMLIPVKQFRSRNLIRTYTLVATDR